MFGSDAAFPKDGKWEASQLVLVGTEFQTFHVNVNECGL